MRDTDIVKLLFSEYEVVFVVVSKRAVKDSLREMDIVCSDAVEDKLAPLELVHDHERLIVARRDKDEVHERESERVRFIMVLVWVLERVDVWVVIGCDGDIEEVVTIVCEEVFVDNCEGEYVEVRDEVEVNKNEPDIVWVMDGLTSQNPVILQLDGMDRVVAVNRVG